MNAPPAQKWQTISVGFFMVAITLFGVADFVGRREARAERAELINQANRALTQGEEAVKLARGCFEELEPLKKEKAEWQKSQAAKATAPNPAGPAPGSLGATGQGLNF